MIERYQVIVVGGGIVGATTACGLAQQGIKVALLDAQVPPQQWPEDSTDLRVSALTRASVNILTALAVWPAMVKQAVSPYRDMKIWDDRDGGELHFDSTETDFEELGFIVENRVTVAALWRALEAQASATLIAPAKVVSNQIDDDCQRLHLEDGRILAAELVIAADGYNSLLRTMSGISVTGWSYQQMGLVTTVTTSESHQMTARQRFLKEGPLAFLPLHDGQCSIVWTLSTETAKQYQALDDQEFLQVLEQASAGFLGAMVQVGPRAAFPLRLQYANEYTDERLALVGDAAHTMHPLAGQGANAGLLDAAAIIELIGKARVAGRPLASRKLLRQYERWRKGDNLVLLGSLDILKRLYAVDNSMLGALRSGGMNFINHKRWLKNYFNQFAMGLRADMPSLAQTKRE